jgi:hypothetical protein
MNAPFLHGSHLNLQAARNPKSNHHKTGTRWHRQGGQALVETVIVIPVMIFTILGALQLMTLQHAQVMTEYCAYNAVRAGIVHHGNWNMMRNAAMFGALPIYERTDSLSSFAQAWAKIKALTEATELVDTTSATLERVTEDLLGVSVAGFLPDISLVEVDVTSPRPEDFDTAFQWQNDEHAASVAGDSALGELVYPEGEVDFDNRRLLQEHPQIGRLAAETRILVPLTMPIVNWIFFQLWYAKQELLLTSVRSNLQQWTSFDGEIADGANAGRRLEDIVREKEGLQVFDNLLLTQQRTKEARLLRDLAVARGIYLIPLRASYAMQMQSNPFKDNRKQPVWFSLAGTSP